MPDASGVSCAISLSGLPNLHPQTMTTLGIARGAGTLAGPTIDYTPTRLSLLGCGGATPLHVSFLLTRYSIQWIVSVKHSPILPDPSADRVGGWEATADVAACVFLIRPRTFTLSLREALVGFPRRQPMGYPQGGRVVESVSHVPLATIFFVYLPRHPSNHSATSRTKLREQLAQHLFYPGYRWTKIPGSRVLRAPGKVCTVVTMGAAVSHRIHAPVRTGGTATIARRLFAGAL